ncbi:MAG: histidine phosphatase family protein [Anaerolineaceae bacterium]|nr:histidine phosphatase family protein [Anaerolineaceae bacterium]
MSIPIYIFEAFENIPTDQAVNVLMRHSIRFPIESEAEIFTAQLTPEGENLAYRFGSWVNSRYQIGKIYSSPINRCIETGRFLGKGAGNNRVVLTEPVLAHPNENGEYDSMDLYLSSGIWPNRIKNIARKLIPDDQLNTLNFYITHDTVLVLMAAYWLNLDIRDPEAWPRYLEPLFFRNSPDGMVITFRDQRFVVPAGQF